MKHAAILMLIFCLPTAAAAQSPECRTVANPRDRLACYDRVAPPAVAGKPTGSEAAPRNVSAPSAAADSSSTPLADLLEMENKRVGSKIKSICRGC
jgi:hypothetical protein